MTTPNPDYYAPRTPTLVDTIAYTNRVVDQILRNNPLQDAVVSRGLIKWLGNYIGGGGDPINFLWIGEFLPADPNLGGIAQRGFSLVRDDSRGGRSAIAMYDANPGASPGLKQSLFFGSGDGIRLMEESRDGGQRWPEEPVFMGPVGNDVTKWVGVSTTAAWSVIFESRFSVIGNRLAYRIFCASDAATSGDYRMRVELPGGDVVGPTHTIGLATSTVFDDSIDITAGRGQTVRAFWEGNRSAGAASIRSSPMSVRCFTP